MVCRSLGLAPCLWTFTCPLRHSGHAVIRRYSPCLLPNPHYYKCRIGSRISSRTLSRLPLLPLSDSILLIPSITARNHQARLSTSLTATMSLKNGTCE